MSESYDVAVIGAGPGGYVAGIKTAQAGLKTVVIEKDRLGGICLNWGCIPTKALLRSAELYSAMGDAADYGLSTGKLGFDGAKIVARSRKVADKMNKGVASLFKKYKVGHMAGEARLASPTQVEVTAPDGKKSTLEAKHIILATGARPRDLPAFPIDGKRVITYRHALQLEKFPKSMLIVGAGAIGVEFAYYFNSFGVEVHLVEMLPHLLPVEDEEIATQLERSFQKQGIHCHTGTAVERFQVGKSGVSAELRGKKDSTKVSAEMALIAVGMRPNTDGLNLEAVGVATGDAGFVSVDGQGRTSVPSIFAIGDLTGRQLLAHKASAEGEVAAAAIAGHAVPPVDYGQIPGCTYCQPQVASIGLTERACKEQGLSYKVGRFPFAASGKANAIHHLEGMVKLIFGEPHGQLLGAHMIGPEVTELLAELGLAMRMEATHEEILATVHAHPTLSEAVFEATGVAFGVSANF